MKFSKFFPFARKVELSSSPVDFAQDLLAWGTTHENTSFLILPPEILRFMEQWAYSYYNDNAYSVVIVLRELVLIASYQLINGNKVVVLDELLETYPQHRKCFERKADKKPTASNLFIARKGA